MSADRLCELDNFSFGMPPALPLGDGSIPPGAPGEEYIDGHGEDKGPDRDIHKPVNDFVFGDSPHPQRQSRHIQLPTPVGFGGGTGRDKPTAVNELNATAPAPFARLTA